MAGNGKMKLFRHPRPVYLARQQCPISRNVSTMWWCGAGPSCCGLCSDEDRDEHPYRCIDELLSRFLAPPPDLLKALWVAASRVAGQPGRHLGHHLVVHSGTTFGEF
jgi:hypothetical protein